MAQRKTFSVVKMVRKINDMLSRSVCSPDARRAMAMIASDLLMDTGNYSGFRYLDRTEVPAGQLPGIVWLDVEGSTEKKPDFPDDSRRFYFLPSWAREVPEEVAESA